MRYLVFFVLDLSTKRVGIAGLAPAPNGLWMNQVERNLIDEFSGFLRGKGYQERWSDTSGSVGS